MTPVRKRNINLVFKFLLLSSYLFLFATQVSDRFYSAANFFVYGSETVNTTGNPDHASPLHKTDHPVIYRKNSDRASHLSVDKRFQYKELLKFVIPFSQGIPYLAEIDIDFCLPVETHILSPDLPINALRGPPCA